MAGASQAQAPAGPPPSILDAVTAEPPVPHPHTQPVVVPLFHDLTFKDYAPKTFTYTPPPGGRRWAKVVLTADFSVTAGRQFDRTAQIEVGGVNVFFGTTAEPSAKVIPRWHVERDLTDDTALLAAPQNGDVLLGNIVDATYTGIISGSAALLFYPADASTPVPETPDLVLPLPTPTGDALPLGTPAQALSGTFSLPTNIVRAYLDVITQSQSKDEFWYTNVPDDLAGELQQNGGTAFREAEITLDDRPAGVAPVFPWVYTGGIDPSLWRPIPGVQTLNLAPYRVDLTPFAAVLSDGHPHTLSLRVFNAGDNFATTATLLLYRDPHQARVSGAVTEDTLTASPTPSVRQDVVVDKDKNANGSIVVTSSRRFVLAGYVLTSRGRVATRSVQHLDFSNRQQYISAGARSTQNVHQQTTLSSATTTDDGAHVRTVRRELAFPFILDSTGFAGQGKSSAQTTTIRQGYHREEQILWDGHPVFSSALTDEVRPSDIAVSDETGRRVRRAGQRSTQVYFYDDSRGGHAHRTLTAADGVLVSDSGGQAGTGK